MQFWCDKLAYVPSAKLHQWLSIDASKIAWIVENQLKQPQKLKNQTHNPP